MYVEENVSHLQYFLIFISRLFKGGIYLSPGDIAAITLGVILLILLLIILIVAICRCCKRRRSEKVKTAPIPRSKKDQA
jgi:hypothetical protein